MRQITSFFVVSALIVNASLAQDSSPARRIAREQLYKDFDGQVALPMAVLQDLVYQQIISSTSEDVRQVILGTSPYRQLTAGDLFVKKLQHDMTAFTLEAAVETYQTLGGSSTLVDELSVAAASSSVARFQKDLQRAAASNVNAVKNLQKAIVPVQVAAIRSVLTDFGSDKQRSEAINQARAAGEQLRSLIAKPVLDEKDISNIKAQGQLVLEAFSDKAKNALGDILGQETLRRTDYLRLADVSLALAQPLTSGVGANLPKITPGQAIELLDSLGGMRNAHAALVNAIHQTDSAGNDFADRLAQGVAELNRGWDQIPISGQITSQREAFVGGFRSLTSVLEGTQRPGLPELANTLSAAGIFPNGSALGNASQAITDLLSRKGDYSNAATGLVSTLSLLNRSGVSIPGIQQLAPALSTANSILKAAGPLVSIAGFASGLSAFSMLGSLGGLGGGGDEAVTQALAQINAKLDQIDRKLDKVIQDIKRLDDKITQYHEEEMHALEGITFEVVRTHELLTLQMHDQVRVPCVRSSDVNDPARESQLNKCMDALQNTFPGPGSLRNPPRALAFETNVQDFNSARPLDKTALDRLTKEVQFRQNLSNLLGETNCEPLTAPSADFEEVERKYLAHNQDKKSASCSAILQTQLVEPGIATDYVHWEQQALISTARLPRRTAIAWWQSNSQALRARWSLKELPLLNQAIAQQAGVSGDVLLPELCGKLDKSLKDPKLGSDFKKVWSADGILAQNVARYWIWLKMREANAEHTDKAAEQGRWIRTLYAFAWESADPAYWHLLTNTAPDTVTFKRESQDSDNTSWFIQFKGLDPVPMATPAEMNLLQLRWPDALSDLVQARQQVIETLSSMDYLQHTWALSKTSAEDILEGFAVAAPAKSSKR